ncbi:MAG: lipase family protein [Actinomycetia bacterium]|nr:lipase family protein [Actinomycetes bacterium]
MTSMLVASAIGPSLHDLRPLKPDTVPGDEPGRFPVYPDLVDQMATAGQAADPEIAHALSVCANYAYASVAGFCTEPDTLARMMARMGMPSNSTLMVADRVDVSFIVSNGFVIQSEDGRVAILCYRGTEPFNPANWLTDADLESEQVTIQVGQHQLTVHPGFYRNVRATRSPLIAALDRACRGRSVVDEDTTVPNRLEALYVTGHSLGGAMAAIMGLLMLNDPAYAELAQRLRAVYTYGAPMIGSPDLAQEVATADQAQYFSRFVYRRDVVPHLPPWGLGRYRHFGQEYRPGRNDHGWIAASGNSLQGPFSSVAMAPVEFISRTIPLARYLWFPYSLSDHLPLNYVSWLAPPGVASEYGDYAAAQ